MSDPEGERIAALEKGVDGLEKRMDKVEGYITARDTRQTVTMASALIAALGVIVSLLR